MIPVNFIHPSFQEKFFFRRVFVPGSGDSRHLFWACNVIETFVLTLSNPCGALYHLFCDDSGLIYLDNEIIRYVLPVPALSSFVSIYRDSRGRSCARISSCHLSRARLYDDSIYLMLLNSPWGSSEGIFSHYYEEFVPFLYQISQLSPSLSRGCSSSSLWLSWKDGLVTKRTWRDDCDSLLDNYLGQNRAKSMYALESPNSSILNSIGDLHVSISRFRLKCVGWTPGSGIASASTFFCDQVADVKQALNGIGNIVIFTREHYSGERRWFNESQCAEFLSDNSDSNVTIISPELYSTQELIALMPSSATIITAPSSAIYPLIFFGSNAYSFVVVEFPGQSTSFGGSLGGELSSYRLGLNGLKGRVFFWSSNNYNPANTRSLYSIRPCELLTYLVSIGALNGVKSRTDNIF